MITDISIVKQGRPLQIRLDLVKKGIADKKLTRAAAAEQIGISDAALAYIMKTGACGSINLGKLAKFLGIPAWELIA